MVDDSGIILFENSSAWARWLDENHVSSPGVWLRLAKKAAAIQSVSYAEALDVALCYGWIDGHKKSDSASTWLQRFTPRGKKSIWSKINRRKALDLIDRGSMKPAGLIRSSARNRMAGGKRRMTRPAPPQCRKTFKRRWIGARERKLSSKH